VPDRSPTEAVPDAVGDRRVFAPGQRILTTGLILIVTLVASEALAIATVMPLVERDLGDLPLYGWVFSAFFLGDLIGVVVAGKAADRMAPVIPFAMGLVLFVVGLVAGGLAGSMPVLVLARGVQGLGAGALPAIVYVCIARAYVPAARPRMFAIASTAWVLPAAIGPGLSGFVGEHLSWRFVFLGLLPIVAGGGGLAMVAIRRLPAPTTVTPGLPVAYVLLLALGAGLLLAGLDSTDVVRAGLLVGAGAVAALVAFPRLTPAGTLRGRPGVPATILLQGVFTFSFFGADAFVPLALTSARGTSVSFAGLVVTAVSLSWTGGAWVQERRIRRTGPRPLVTVGLCSVAVGSALMVVVVATTVPVALAVVAWAIAGLGAGLTYGPLSAAMLAGAPAGEEGETTAGFQLTEVLGIAVGSGVGGALVAFGAARAWTTATSVTVVFLVSVAVALSGLVLARRIPASVLVR
jgi:MFS family permease